MPAHTSRLFLGFALAAVLLFAATACGGDDSPDTPSGAGSPAAVASPGTPAPTRDLGTTVPVTVVAGGDSTVRIAIAPDGPYLTDAEGLTLYTTLNDAPDSGTSSCIASCSGLWPPLLVEGAPVAPEGLTGSLGVITRPGSPCGEPNCPDVTQVTYNGLPLYRHANDKVPGDQTARDLGGIWSLVAP